VPIPIDTPLEGENAKFQFFRVLKAAGPQREVRKARQHGDEVRMIGAERALLQRQSLLVIPAGRGILLRSGRVITEVLQQLGQYLRIRAGPGQPHGLVAVLERVLNLALGLGRLETLVGLQQFGRLRQGRGRNRGGERQEAGQTDGAQPLRRGNSRESAYLEPHRRHACISPRASRLGLTPTSISSQFTACVRCSLALSAPAARCTIPRKKS